MLGGSIFALGALASLAPPTTADKSTDPLFAELAAKSADNFLRGMDRGDRIPGALLVAYTDAYGWVNLALEKEGRPLLYCVPPKLGLMPEQAGGILRRYVKTHPRKGKYPASMVILEAMQETFPCPTENR